MMEKDNVFNVNNEWVDLGLVWGDRALQFFCEILLFFLKKSQ